MLSIIPKEVLSSLKNIHKLLDIGNSFKGSNAGKNAGRGSTLNF